jgi:polysaccharide export outer membrane protein
MSWALGASPSLDAGEGYPLGPGDIVRVEVYGHADMGREVTIPERCSVELPFVGAVPVCGQTTQQAAVAIQARLADGYLVKPEVLVDLVEFGSKRVVVKGAVKRPGVQVLKGKTSISEVIAEAGGPSEANVFEVVLLQENNETRSFLLNEIDALEDSVIVQAGDTIILNYGLFVYVHGEVKQEGAVPFRKGLTVTQALGFAGGMTEFASGRRVRIVKATGEKIRVNINRIHRGMEADYEMDPTDKLIIQRSFL